MPADRQDDYTSNNKEEEQDQEEEDISDEMTMEKEPQEFSLDEIGSGDHHHHHGEEIFGLQREPSEISHLGGEPLEISPEGTMEVDEGSGGGGGDGGGGDEAPVSGAPSSSRTYRHERCNSQLLYSNLGFVCFKD